MNTQTMNMFAETNEDMPILSGAGRTEAATAKPKLSPQDAWAREVASGACLIVEAESVEDFLNRYLLPYRYKGRNSEYPGYSDAVLATHKERFEKLGYTLIAEMDSSAGHGVYYWPE